MAVHLLGSRSSDHSCSGCQHGEGFDPKSRNETAWLTAEIRRGVTLSFGIFQTYYSENYLNTYSLSEISWIGTIQAFLLIFVGVLSGPLFDKGYLRSLTVGLMTTSVARHFYSIILALGVCTGIGMGCLFVPSITVVNTYFTTKRVVASGIAATGGGIGKLIA
jgi:MFS family permease